MIFNATHGKRSQRAFVVKKEQEVTMQNALLAEINNLSITERILLVEDIWDHLIDADDSAFALSDAQRSEIDRRITHYQDQPEAGRFWSDVKEECLHGKQ